MTYAHDSLKTHYIYLARFSQELAITFKADLVFWAGDNQVREGKEREGKKEKKKKKRNNQISPLPSPSLPFPLQVYNQNFVSAIAKDLRDTFTNHPKSTWVKDIPIYTQSESVNINLLG